MLRCYKSFEKKNQELNQTEYGHYSQPENSLKIFSLGEKNQLKRFTISIYRRLALLDNPIYR